MLLAFVTIFTVGSLIAHLVIIDYMATSGIGALVANNFKFLSSLEDAFFYHDDRKIEAVLLDRPDSLISILTAQFMTIGNRPDVLSKALDAVEQFIENDPRTADVMKIPVRYIINLIGVLVVMGLILFFNKNASLVVPGIVIVASIGHLYFLARVIRIRRLVKRSILATPKLMHSVAVLINAYNIGPVEFESMERHRTLNPE